MRNIAQRLDMVIELIDLGLITKEDALKLLSFPDLEDNMSDHQEHIRLHTILMQQQMEEYQKQVQKQFDEAIVNVLKPLKLSKLEAAGAIEYIADYLLNNPNIISDNSVEKAVEIAFNAVTGGLKQPVSQFPAKPQCTHEYTLYHGLAETYEYCTKCNERKT